MVEVARLESVYRFIAYPGFESPSLRQKIKQKATLGWLFAFWRREARPLRALRRGFEDTRLPARGSPNRPSVVEVVRRAAADNFNGAARRGRAFFTPFRSAVKQQAAVGGLMLYQNVPRLRAQERPALARPRTSRACAPKNVPRLRAQPFAHPLPLSRLRTRCRLSICAPAAAQSPLAPASPESPPAPPFHPRSPSFLFFPNIGIFFVRKTCYIF